MGVNVAALVRYYVREEKKQILNLLSPLLGFLICAFIWTHLSGPALKLGAIWMALGMTYGAIKTRGFQAELVNFDIPPDEN
jgi:putrescine importer